MKTTKIAPGFYKLEYKRYKISLVHTNDMPNADWWYFTYVDLNGEHNDAQDTYSTKKLALEGAIEWIDYLTK